MEMVKEHCCRSPPQAPPFCLVYCLFFPEYPPTYPESTDLLEPKKMYVSGGQII